MPPKQKRRTIDLGKIIGAIIFVVLFLGLILLGIFVENDAQFDSSFFDDVGKTMQGKY